MRRPLLLIVLAPTSLAAVWTIAFRFGAGSTDRQQERAPDADVRGRSIGCVAQPTSVTMAIAVVMKRNRIASPNIEKPEERNASTRLVTHQGKRIFPLTLLPFTIHVSRVDGWLLH
jgi:hypothetical protein